ncbi:MAG: c-type cytochrome [Gammaproteobacteria bacterium]
MTRFVACVAFCLFIGPAVLAQPSARRADSPAAAPVPETLIAQDYAPDLVASGRGIFAAQCGFCHGLDTGGGSGGPDLTRSDLVARDVRGDLIGAVVRAGRPEAEVPMPAFPALGGDDLAAVVAFVHDQKSRAESVEGGRRAVSPEDVQSGNIRAGRRFFERNCVECHSADGDLDGIASRMEGLALLQQMLYPRPSGPRAARSTRRVVVTTEQGETVAGLLDYEDEFSLALIDADGLYHSFATSEVTYEVDNPLDRHLELLATYTDEEMHDVVTYLHTLR